MFNAIRATASQWLRYHQTLHALGSLDPRLRADLGLTGSELSSIAAKAARSPEPVSIFALAGTRSGPVGKKPNAKAVPVTFAPRKVTQAAQIPCAGKAGSLHHCPA